MEGRPLPDESGPNLASCAPPWPQSWDLPSPRAAATALLTGGLFGLGILPQALQRPDSTHLAWVAVVSWSLLVPLLALWGTDHTPATAGRSLLATAVVGVMMLVICPFYTYRHHLLHTRVALGDLPPPFLVERDGKRFWFGDKTVADALNAMIPDLEARSDRGDRLIVGPADLSRTIYSDVSVYYLFPELEPGTRYIEMDPGLADRAGSGLAEDIAAADYVVLTNIWTGWNEPNASDKHLSDEANRAVADNFCLTERYADNLVLLFERCEGGGGVNPAEVTGTYPVGCGSARLSPPAAHAVAAARSPAPVPGRANVDDSAGLQRQSPEHRPG